MTSFSKTAAVLAGLFVASGVQAQQSITGTVGVQLTLQSGCAIYSGGGSPLASDFGTLNFGTESAAFSGTLNAQVISTGGATTVVCSPDATSITVKVDGGQNAGQGATIGAGSRAMKLGTSDYVPYEIYSDSGHTEAYAANTAKTYTIPTPGQPFTLPIYGLVNKTSPAALPVGTYQDTLSVTVEW